LQKRKKEREGAHSDGATTVQKIRELILGTIEFIIHIPGYKMLELNPIRRAPRRGCL